VQRADDVVVRRQPRAGDTMRNHLGVTQYGRTARKRLACGAHEACAERDMAAIGAGLFRTAYFGATRLGGGPT
jgi:hypothetical protein